uniref:Uncharacterized protein n=1 Tax=Prolemur simus TaxID=1328070 RepID=A0A8C9DUH5_PROSS
MAEVEPGASLFPNGVPWLYALFAMLFVFFLFVMFSPFLLEIDQHIKRRKFLLRCRYSLHNAVHKDKENNQTKMDHLGRPGEYSLPFTFGERNISPMRGKETQAYCPGPVIMTKDR